MLLAIPVLVLLAVLVAILLTRRRGADPVVRRQQGRLAERVAQAPRSGDQSIDAYVDGQAAVWDQATGATTPGRPALFREDVGRPDPRTPDAYDVSDLYLADDEHSGDQRSTEPHIDDSGVDEESFDRTIEELSQEPVVEEPVVELPGVEESALEEPGVASPSVEDTIGDLDTDYGWEYVEPAAGEEADRAFAADLDDVDDPELDRFAPPRVPDAPDDDEFASELLGATDGAEHDPCGSDLDPGELGSLEQRTSKVTAEISAQPFRLARTQQRPTGGSRRSPEQIRSFLSSYRRGVRKGREEPRPDPVDGER